MVFSLSVDVEIAGLTIGLFSSHIIDDIVVHTGRQFFIGLQRCPAIGDTSENIIAIVIALCLKDFYAPAVIDLHGIFRE